MVPQNGTNELVIPGIFRKCRLLVSFGTGTPAARARFAFLEVTVRFLKPTCKMFDVFYKQ